LTVLLFCISLSSQYLLFRHNNFNCGSKILRYTWPERSCTVAQYFYTPVLIGYFMVASTDVQSQTWIVFVRLLPPNLVMGLSQKISTLYPKKEDSNSSGAQPEISFWV